MVLGQYQECFLQMKAETPDRGFKISGALGVKRWGGRRDLNPQRPEPQSGALPIELLPPFLQDYSNWGESCQKGTLDATVVRFINKTLDPAHSTR
jgi:hypothetical protein